MSATLSTKQPNQSFQRATRKYAQALPMPCKFNQKRRSLTSSIIQFQKQKQKSANRFVYNPERKLKTEQSKEVNLNIKPNQICASRPQSKTSNCPFNNKSSLNSEIKFKLHDPQFCVCQYCTCGRHLCNLHPNNRPKINHDSLYKRDYNRKSPIGQIIPLKHTQSPALQGSFTPISTYGKDFYPKSRSVDSRIKPEDGIKQDGAPFSGLTTYSSQFPNFKKEQVYPKGKNIGGQTVTNMKFIANSTYRKQYQPKQGSSNPNSIKNNLRLGNMLIGDSTYNSNFNEFDVTYESASWLNKEQAMNPLEYRHQYETTYRNDFLKSKSVTCKAKVELQTRRGFYKTAKKSFRYNSNFKEMDPSFQSLSTTK